VVRQDSGEHWQLSGPSDFALRLRRCPLRYVLADDLVRVCTALAYSDGDQLSGCLDLLHFPAEELWIEWDDSVRRAELARILPAGTITGAEEIPRAGTLISAHPSGRSGKLRTFWLARSDPPEPVLAAIETRLDLDGGIAFAPPTALLEGGEVGVGDPRNAAVDALLRCTAFKLDPSWQRYYHAVARSAPVRCAIIQHSLGSVAFDIPIVLALFLLMAIRADLVHVAVPTSRLNAKRARLGKRPLLEHIEISAPVYAAGVRSRLEALGNERRGPRFHHVRGHIVRRANAIYWRSPHWRGHVRLGCVRSRTVELQLPV